MAPKNVVTEYHAPRLLFKRDVISRLRPSEAVRIQTPEGDFVFTREEFERVFNNVASNQVNYLTAGEYSYPKTPAKALQFLESRAAVASVQNVPLPKKKKSPWPTWDQPAESVLTRFFKETLYHYKFLSPNIVEAVVRDNKKNHGAFSDLLGEFGITPGIYLWEGSPCAYPGVRRGTGGDEKKGSVVPSNRAKEKEAFYIDHNKYAKDIWSFVFRRTKFGSKGPKDYSLAHLLDHKAYNKGRTKVEITGTEPLNSFALSGLFSSAANTCFAPNSILRPTDFHDLLRRLLQWRAYNLYKGICQILPPGIGDLIPLPKLPDELQDLKWAPPVGTMENVPAFLVHREEELQILAKKSRGSK